MATTHAVESGSEGAPWRRQTMPEQRIILPPSRATCRSQSIVAVWTRIGRSSSSVTTSSGSPAIRRAISRNARRAIISFSSIPRTARACSASGAPSSRAAERWHRNSAFATPTVPPAGSATPPGASTTAKAIRAGSTESSLTLPPGSTSRKTCAACSNRRPTACSSSPRTVGSPTPTRRSRPFWATTPSP